MNPNILHLPNQKYFSTLNEDPFDEYFERPNLNVFDMIQQYDAPSTNTRKKKEKRNLRCTVCAAKAVGYNFDQITCESCKAFFRRNALRDIKELHCRFSGTCAITIDTRRHCPYCRIKKCFAVGMRKDWIRSEEDKDNKRTQLERTRRRKHPLYNPKIPSMMISKYSKNLVVLSPTDRIRVNNITNCYNEYFNDPCVKTYIPASTLTLLRLDQLFNRKKSIYVNFISCFKHLPELQNLDVDDQVSLIKQNIRIVMPLNYAILRGPSDSRFRTVCIQTVNCKNNANVHEMLRELADIFAEFVIHDPIIVKLLIIVLLFTTTSLTTRSIYDPGAYKQINYIKQIQSSYIELLWLYMLEKYGDYKTILLFTKMISKYLQVQLVIDETDAIIEVNNDIQNVDSLMKTMLQLT